MNELPRHPNLYAVEIIKFTRLSKAYVYELIERGEIPSIKIGAVYRIPREDFIKWWEARRSHHDLVSL